MKGIIDMTTGKIELQRGYDISVDNSSAMSHNINIDCPTYFCFAFTEAEAIGKMILSDFPYKHKPIISISSI